tara:strand:- start:1464 stop:2474 length:1011 start_codon:yes stop_codon:yes gene_type:complete
MRKLTFSLVFLAILFSKSSFSQTLIKIATLAPQNTAWATHFQSAAAEISELTDNRVKLKFYWGGSQGNEKKVLQKIKIGQLHGGTFTPTDFQERYPDVNIIGLPFLFKSIDEVNFVREVLDKKMEEGFNELGFEIFGFAGGGFAYIMSNRPVIRYSDMTNKKIWIPQGDLISYQTMKALNLVPVPLVLTDVLTALQTGLIDIVSIPPVVALALQWHTKIKYFTRVPVLYAMGFMAIDNKIMNKISAEDKNVLSKILRETYALVDASNNKDTTDAINALFNVGIEEVDAIPDEIEDIRKSALLVNQKMAEEGMFSKKLFDEIQILIEQYRQNQKHHF